LKKVLKKLKYREIGNILFQRIPGSDLKILPLPSALQLKIFDKNIRTGINIIDRNKNSNNVCYAVFDNEKIVHTSWIFRNKLLAKQLGYNNALTIGDSVTAEPYRGMGIYPAVLSCIEQHFKNYQLIIFTEPANTASQKGILKAGFTRLYRFKLIRLLGLKIYLKRYAD